MLRIIVVVGLNDGACVFILVLSRTRRLLRFVWWVVGHLATPFPLGAVLRWARAADAVAVLLCFAAVHCMVGSNGEVLVAVQGLCGSTPGGTVSSSFM